jgi:hypothetical protein
MADLNTLANLAEILGVIIVIGGLAFAVIQIREFRRQRTEAAALDIARSFHKPDFAHAVLLVVSLPAGCSSAQLRSTKEQQDAAMLVSLTLESFAIMVHRRIVGLDMLWELMGGVTLTCWDRMQDWVHTVRQEQRNEKFDEWLEWLANQLDRYSKGLREPPAYIHYEAWRP